EILLDTEPEGTVALRDHLERHLIADDAEWRALEDAFCAIAVEGPQSEERLRAILAELPVQPYGVIALASGWIARIASTGLAGFRLWIPITDLTLWIERLSAAGIPPAAPEEARCVRIENGKPRFGEEITIRFLGPEINLSGTIATGKGCYLGQEVVERVRSRNLLTRVLAPITMPERTRVAAGAKLFDGERRVGEVLSVACSPRNGALRGIASVALPQAVPGVTLQCAQVAGCEVTIAS
ncbi:MAG: hypothetical protein KJZ70_01805, partial [Bryobacterales bacterium]|nr:hypothetical protein [Bryobacterales bacterium]